MAAARLDMVSLLEQINSLEYVVCGIGQVNIFFSLSIKERIRVVLILME